MPIINVKNIIIFLVVNACFLQAQKEFLVPANGNIEQIQKMLDQAKDSENEKNWEKAAELYQKIMAAHNKVSSNNKDILVEDGKKLYRNVQDIVRENIKQFSPEALDIYRNMISARAEALADTKDKKFIIDNFLFTRIGTKSLIQVCDNYILQEKYQEAIRYIFMYLHYIAKESQQNTTILARLAFCYYATNDILGLRNVMDTVKKYAFDDSIVIGGNKTTVGSYTRKLYKKLKTRGSKTVKNSNWQTLGGNLQRNFQQQNMAFPNLKMPKSVMLQVAPREKDSSYYINEQNRQKNGPVQYYPVIADNMLFVNNSKSVFAYELPSLKLKWKYEGLITKIRSDWHEQTIHSISYHDGAVYANVEGNTKQEKQYWQIYLIRKILAERRLVKLDARTGRVMWIVKESAKKDQFESRISFMGPPVAWQNKLIVAATEIEGLFNSYILALDPETGKTLWSKLIGSAHQELNLFGRPVREAVGARLAISNGKIYYLTNLGGIACLDPENGRISWVQVYDRIPVRKPTRALFHTIYRDIGWHQTPIMVWGKYVYAAPIDSNYLYCINSWNGKRVWRIPRSYQYKYVLGIYDGSLIIGGQNNITLINATTGKTQKYFSILRDKVVGFGSIISNKLYCPGLFYLYIVDLKSQEIKKVSWPRLSSPGHLVTANGLVATVSDTRICVYFDFKKMIGMYEEQIKKNPKDTMLHIKLANLYTQYSENKRDFLIKAEKHYLKAREIARNEQGRQKLYWMQEINDKLLSVYRKIAEHFEKHNDKQVFEYYNKIIQFTDDKYITIPLYLKLFAHYKKNAKKEKAFSTLNALKNKYGKEYFAINFKKTLIDLYVITTTAEYNIQLRQYEQAIHEYQKTIILYPNENFDGRFGSDYGYSKIQQLINAQGRNIYLAYDTKARSLYDQKNNATYWSVFKKYPNSFVAPKASIKITKELINKNLLGRAIIHLNNHIKKYRKDKEALTQAYYLLLQCYEEKQQFIAAFSVLHNMNKNFANNTLVVDGKSTTVKDFVKKRLQNPMYSGINKTPMPSVQINFANFVKREIYLKVTNRSHEFVPTKGHRNNKYKNLVFVSLDTPKGMRLHCYDASTYRIIWQASLGWPIRSVEFVQDKIVVWNDSTVFVIKPENGQIIWQTNVGPLTNLHTANDTIYTVSGDRLKCVIAARDYRTGNTLWEQTIDSPVTIDWLPETLVTKDYFIASFVRPAKMFIINVKTGKREKVFSDKRIHKNLFFYPVVLNNSFLAVVKRQTSIECYILPSLKKAWAIEANNIEHASVKGNDQYVFWATKDHVALTDLISGGEKWKKPKNSRSYVQKALFDFSNFYFATEDNTTGYTLSSVNTDTNTFMWQFPIGESTEIPEIVLTQKYVLCLTNRFFNGCKSRFVVFNKSNGKLLKKYELNEGDRSHNSASLQIVNNEIWLLKNHTISIIGK
ncbi:PQQ-binding-like beta-propeller repeat protein [Candidatus Uabimicrobium sp. HlEnr_7]|uniref:outer membrane protein assembly factor BamB family protein n=1 Tax=Candidatus Uabimicrobium helgolandensis TaxID=3095367 RepID=UPI003557C3FD